ncbi:hypothetical protein [Autumnicola psychrophila]|uniref:CHRD domain-containing protein n=1 Tax=Autumnicola psychrophila TaxID=3075592 RepID=A0ABU3DSI8_9FLAO|nr:hypothetical protein [Zunongwangia sp. F225]MDT0686677.1 hypothetical protein [Zunongwangia sp. F225]
MKKFKITMMSILALTLFLTSCSKEESEPAIEGSTEKATLSFGATLNDLLNNRSQTKNHFADVPECSDAAPASVMIVLSMGGVDMDAVTLNVLSDDLDNDGVMDYFTDYSADLELTPGIYQLEEFIVYDAADNMIWIAPIDDDDSGEFNGYVTDALPITINLGAGVKKYVDVEVLCFDDREVNQYGYLFFDFEGKEVIEFCLFGNFCPPNGRHYVASYSVDVWLREDGENTDQLYDGLSAEVEMENGEYSAAPLCFALPDGAGDDEYYFEITIMETDQYETTERIIRSGVITDMEVRSFFDGDDNLDYLHFFYGCGQTDTPPIFTDPQDEAKNYKACLKDLNDSGAVAFSYARLEGNTLYTSVLAYNMEVGQRHPQHIHGFTVGTDANEDNATCPDMGNDTNGNGFVEIGEGAPYYGPVQLSLVQEDGNFPLANPGMGMYFYERTFTLTNADLELVTPLDKKVTVLHGLSVDLDGAGTADDDDYEGSLPVACGEFILQ